MRPCIHTHTHAEAVAHKSRRAQVLTHARARAVTQTSTHERRHAQSHCGETRAKNRVAIPEITCAYRLNQAAGKPRKAGSSQ